MKNKLPLELTELRRSMSRARRASSAMLTFSTLLELAVVASEDDSEKRDRLPTLSELSNLCETLAHGAEEAFVSVDLGLQQVEKLARQEKAL